MVYEIILAGGECIGKTKFEESAHDMARYASALRPDTAVYIATRWTTINKVDFLYRYFNGERVRAFNY